MNTSSQTTPPGATYWTRLFLGALSGILCGVTSLDVEGIVVGIALYAVSILDLSLIWGIPLRSIAQHREFYTMGLGTYLAVWFTVWILVNTIMLTL